MTCLIIISGPNEGQMFTFETDEHLLGRGDDCSIQLVDEKASRNHCKVTCHAGNSLGGTDIPSKQWIVEDLGSSNGTTLDGVKIEAIAPLSEGNMIGIGTTKAVFLRETFDTSAQAREYADNLLSKDVSSDDESWPLDPPWISKTLGED
jgi:pSer/pThr/pTyr-binding forkhead associated (FHA) protein